MKIYQKRKFAFAILILLLALENLIVDSETGTVTKLSLALTVILFLQSVDILLSSLAEKEHFDIEPETEEEQRQLLKIRALDASLEITLVISFLVKFILLILGKLSGQIELEAIGFGLVLAHFISRLTELLTHQYYKKKHREEGRKVVDKNTVSKVMEKMVAYSEGNLHDISHFMKVYGFARTIGIREKLPKETQYTVEIAAILHDIACPLCREKYGNTNGKYQEKEGGPLAETFLKEINLPSAMEERIIYLVSHHHTYEKVEGIDYRILLEADFLVNADESHMGKEAILKGKDLIFETETGKRLLNSIYLAEPES
ncbi:MAG TPA: HD domain-containing protein [Clostridiales bacterium]|nr:HD domain-containing protein [Clostridiales bacterium]